MQNIPAYKAELESIRATINKLHARVWRLLHQPDNVKPHPQTIQSLHLEIDALNRRTQTVNYLIWWLERGHSPSACPSGE